MKLTRTLAALVLAMCAGQGFDASAQTVSRVEPPCWWVGMNTPLQIMLYGENLRGSEVALAQKVRDVKVTAVHDADSPNYLFVDVAIGARASAGEYRFVVTSPSGVKSEFVYSLEQRRADRSHQQVSFGPQDMVYLLMPDRFANGDPSNDSTDDTVEKANRSFGGGRHGGDLQGIADHLDYLSDLGVTCIWPTPLLLDNEKTYSYHGYACADYYLIDPRYGDNDLYRNIVDAAHQKGIKFIMDIVPNHCGTAHWWMDDLPFKDWVNTFDTYTNSNFALSTQSDPHTSDFDAALSRTGWFDTTMPDMNMTNPFFRQYFTQVAVWWIEFANLDGLRVDTFPYGEKYSTAQWVASILAEYPTLNIVAECWMGDTQLCAYYEGGVGNRDGYDSHLPSVMDFPLMGHIHGALNRNNSGGWGDPATMEIYNSISLDFAYNDPSDILIFAGNHDTNRLAYTMQGSADRVKMAMALLATMRGVPQLYYGDELMFKAPKQRTGHSEERLDFIGGWPEDKTNLFDASCRSAEQNDVHDYIAALFNWRKTSEAVHRGHLTHFRPSGENIYVYFRTFDGAPCVMTVINNGDTDLYFDWSRYAEMLPSLAKEGREVVTGQKITVGEPFAVEAMSAMVIEFGPVE